MSEFILGTIVLAFFFGAALFFLGNSLHYLFKVARLREDKIASAKSSASLSFDIFVSKMCCGGSLFLAIFVVSIGTVFPMSNDDSRTIVNGWFDDARDLGLTRSIGLPPVDQTDVDRRALQESVQVLNRVLRFAGEKRITLRLTEASLPEVKSAVRAITQCSCGG